MNIKLTLRDFESQILYFNGMYKLPIAPFPSAGKIGRVPDIIKRLEGFQATVLDEIAEVDEILTKLRIAQAEIADGKVATYTEMELLVELADWLGDIQVYCASEMAKFGLPLKETLKIIMSSNFSKMGADGVPVYDENGKVLKGPGYWKPEPQIRQMLEEKITEAMNEKKDAIPTGIIWREDRKES